LQGPPGIKGDRGMDGTKGEPVSKNLNVGIAAVCILISFNLIVITYICG
jgi:hypothetical protein